MRRWLERQARQSFDQGAMPNYPTKDSASSPEALVSNDIAPNGSTGNDEMNKNEFSDRECSSAEAHSRASV